MTWLSPRSTTAAAGLGALLLVVMWARGGDDVPAGPTVAAGTSGAGPRAHVEVADLKLETLQQKGAELTQAERDPFRFQVRQAPAQPAAPQVARGGPPMIGPPRPPAGPPPVPPIQLRFIGLVEAPTQGGRVAILSDGRGTVLYGKEGDTIEGRYRLLKVGADAVELAYVDGSGRQTVRLAGQ